MMVISRAKKRIQNINAYCLHLEDIHLWRGNTTILRGINWQVKQGEHWAVLGPNGSGKTTLIMVIAGYRPSSRGRIFLIDGWLGEIILPEQRKKVGIVSYPLSNHIANTVPCMPAIDIVISGLYASLGLFENASNDEYQKALKILSDIKFPTVIDRPFGKLSTGEKQSCMLARSKMADNAIVLLDEPCAGLDIGGRERFLSTLQAMIDAEKSPTVILVTHHVEEIVSGISHVLLLREGEVIAAGPKAEILTSSLLSQAFDITVRVMYNNERYWVTGVE